MDAPLQIAIDTREQAPWHFPEDMAVCRRATVDAGDYALFNEDGTVDNGFAVERKSLADFVGTISTGWERFAREIGRMDAARFPCKLIVVEGDDGDIVAGNYNHPDVMPPFVTSQIVRLQWMGVHVYMAGNPHRAAQIAWRHLYERWMMVNDPFWDIARTK